MSLPAVSTRTRLPDSLPLLLWDPSKKSWEGQGAEWVEGALSGWAPGFQLQLWGRGRAGILPKARAPSSLGTQLQRPATQLDTDPEKG